MVKSISVALGDPDIYTNALSNRYLPFVAEWDLMSEADKTEIIEFWTPEEVGRRLGNRMFAEKSGFHADEYAELRILWSKKGGTSCRDQEKGIFDTTDERLVAGGISNWGQHAVATEGTVVNRMVKIGNNSLERMIDFLNEVSRHIIILLYFLIL
jgi:hypothetical protein